MISTHNPGNLRPLPDGGVWQGQAGTIHTATGDYCRFADAPHGIRAMARNLLAYKHAGIGTLQGVFERWAPGGDGNDPAGYARFVADRIGRTVDEPVDLADAATLVAICQAITIMENGHPPKPMTGWYSDTVFREGVAMALGTAAF